MYYWQIKHVKNQIKSFFSILGLLTEHSMKVNRLMQISNLVNIPIDIEKEKALTKEKVDVKIDDKKGGLFGMPEKELTKPKVHNTFFDVLVKCINLCVGPQPIDRTNASNPYEVALLVYSSQILKYE